VRTRRMQQINTAAALATRQNWARAFDGMNETISRNFARGRADSRAWRRPGRGHCRGMTQSVVQNLVKQAIAYATFAQTQDAIDARQKLKDAASAARGAFKSVMHALPFPANVIVAPMAAAGAFAAVEAFEHGGVVGGSRGMAVPVLAHAGERVLTPTQTQNFETLVNNRSTSSSVAQQPQRGSRSALPWIEGDAARGCARHERCAPPRASEVRMSLSVFPSLPGLSWPVLKSSEFATLTQDSPNFFETRIQQAKNPRWHWEMTFDVLRDTITLPEYRQLQGFILGLGGSSLTFSTAIPATTRSGPH
jgi:hypothetical protein